MPSPLRRPPLLRIEARDTWPRMTAGIPANTLNGKARNPSTMLITALRSVSALLRDGAAAAAPVPAAVCFGSPEVDRAAPHFGQKEAGSLMAAPQVEQCMYTSI